MSAAGVDATAAQLAGVGKSADAARARFMTLAAVGAGVLVAAFVAVGVKAGEMAGNYEAAVTRLFTTAGEQKSALGMIGSGVLDMSTQVGTGAQTLIGAMYYVESAGLHGQKGLDVLRIAAMGAKTENSDLNSVVKTLVSTLNAYTGTGLTAAGAMNTMIAAVSQGHMTLNDLAGAVSNVLPATARFGISLIDTTGAIAEMTKQGDNASSAATHLRQMILALEAPSKIGAASMKLVGLSSQQLSDEMKKSLPGAIQMVTDAVGKKFPEGSAKYNEAIKNIAGGSRQMMGFLELSGKHTKDFADIVKIMSGDVKAGGKSIMGWADVQGNFNFKMDQAKAAGEKFMIVLGEKLLPVFGKIVDALTPLISGLANFVSTLNSSSPVLAILGGILAGLAVIILVAVVPAIIAFGAAMLSAEIMGAPLILIVLAVIAVVTAIILVIQHWGQISTWIGGVMSALGTKVHEIVGNIGAAFSALGSKVQSVLAGIGAFFSGLGTKIHDVLSGIGTFVGGVFSGIGTKIHDALLAAATFVYQKVTDIENFFKSIPGKIQAALANLGAILLAPFKWLYDHNYYVKAAVDSAINIFNQMKAKVGEIFSAIGTFFHDKLTTIKNNFGTTFDWIGTHVRDVLTATKNTVGSIFSAIGTTIQNVLTTIKNFVGNIFSTIGTWIHDRLTAAKNDVGNIFSIMGSLVSQKLNDLKNAVGNAFSTLGTLMHQKLSDAWNALVSFASGWPSQAFNWGVNLVMGLVNGLGSLLGKVRDMAGQIAGAIGNYLGFHSPAKEGPGADADTWMPNLVTMLVSGLRSNQGKMKDALNSLMLPLATNLQASLSLTATGSTAGGLSSAGLLSGSIARTSIAGGGATHNITINVQPPDTVLDGVRVSRQLLPHLHRAILYNTGHIGP